MKRYFVFSNFCIVAIFATIAFAQERDPFAPYVWEKPSQVIDLHQPNNEDGLNLNPLTNNPLSFYRVIGIVVAPEEAIAVLKAKDKKEYLVTLGDRVGIEGGMIETISTKGVTFNTGDDLITLNVDNRFDIEVNHENTN